MTPDLFAPDTAGTHVYRWTRGDINVRRVHRTEVLTTPDGREWTWSLGAEAPGAVLRFARGSKAFPAGADIPLRPVSGTRIAKRAEAKVRTTERRTRRTVNTQTPASKGVAR